MSPKVLYNNNADASTISHNMKETTPQNKQLSYNMKVYSSQANYDTTIKDDTIINTNRTTNGGL